MSTRTALVLAGGGSYGAVQVGMLRALCTHSMPPDLVAGSVGAINGAFYAGDPSARGIEKLAALWRGLRRTDIFPVALRRRFGARDTIVEVQRVAQSLRFPVGLVSASSAPGYARIWRLPVSFTIDRQGLLAETVGKTTNQSGRLNASISSLHRCRHLADH